MNIDFEAFAKLLAPVLTLLVGAVVKHFTEGRAKVISFIGHVSSFTIQDAQKTQVYTHSVIVRNAGRRPATNVRLGHHALPPNVRVEPQVQYSIERNPDGAAEIVFPTLVPKEQVTISYLYYPPLTWNQVNAYAKSDEGFAKVISVIPMVQPPREVIWVFWALAFVGASFLTYWLVKLVAVVI
ncbi:hypothetical protein [Iodobacter fluviatilis]|uniref:Uncharacterized protein n=1 Tax=Iodobacter fluviatilis TaxID=537 RepID=A0A7G3GCB6_9NEIS|nr:hypothetical protein [Iodobacter fluviatilis]QBC45230.1 hypothetical protein C1H71_17950 [Iodobacter fluviatilis]